MAEIFSEYKKEIERQVKKAKKLLGKKSKNPKTDNYFVLGLSEKINQIDSSASVDIPPSHIDSDIAISGVKKENFEKIVEMLEKIPEISRVEGKDVFVNIWLKQESAYKDSLSAVVKLGKSYGASDVNLGQTAIIEYSSPNITKPIGVGHLRSTVIGQALSSVYNATGFTVVRENYLGDWGTQFGKVIYGYQNWIDRENFNKDPITELKNVYVRFTEEAEKDPEIEEKAREIFKSLENGDKELVGLWKSFRNMSIEAYSKIYEKLGTEFDVYSGEGYFSSGADDVIDECLKSGICKSDEAGAVIVDSLVGLPSFLLRKSDGTTLYLSRDVAMMRFRSDNYKPDKILIVAGGEQVLHFRQVSGLSRSLKYIGDNEFHHVDFGAVLVDGKKMSTRKGTVVELEDLINQSIEKSVAIIKQKNPDLKEKEVKEISEIVGIGAVIYNDLRQSRRTNISFDWDKMLNFETGSAAYLQYTYARIQSILRKALSPKPYTLNPIFEHESEWLLARKLLFFPAVVLRAQKLNAPHLVATYLEELAQLFNAFYGTVSIINTENEDLKNSRLVLIGSVAEVIKNGLALLNINVPKRM